MNAQNIQARGVVVDDSAEDLRRRCREIMERDGLSQAGIGRQLGVAEQTFSAWLNDKYSGRNDIIADKVRIGLDTLEARSRAASVLPPDLGYRDTPTGRKITAHLLYAHHAPAIAVVAGGAGIGKTVTAKRYTGANANVWMATVEPCSGSVYPMLGLIADAMGVEERVQTRLSAAIRKFVAGKGGLLIVDEAQHLETKALDQLRALPDAVDVGLALLGNERVYKRLEGGGRQAEFAQLYSRIGKTMTQIKPLGEDVDVLIDAWGITGKTETKLLRLIADKGGALRSMSMALRSAAMMAGGADRIALAHIKTAYAELSHQSIEPS
jgi:hypothetical protein